MKKSPYLPADDQGKMLWLNNFAAKFAIVANTLGFKPADVTAVNSYATMFAWLMNAVETLTSAKETFVGYKNLIRSGPIGSPIGSFPVVPTLPAAPAEVAAGIFPIISKMVEQIKGSPKYTEAMGKDLGIIGAEQPFDPSTMQPALKLVFQGGAVEIKWRKGQAQAIRIEVDRGTGFQFLAIDSVPDYTDTFPITGAATWKYKAIYLIADQMVGQWSDVVSITVG